MNHIFRPYCSVSPICTHLPLQDVEAAATQYLQSFHEMLALRRWKRQLFMRRVAALWRYTEFFMITGILASSSALRMHSSKNSEKTLLWAVTGETLQATNQSQGTALTDGLSQVMTLNTSLDLHKQQSVKLQNIIRMNKFKVTKNSSPQQMHIRTIERTTTIHTPSIIPTAAHDSSSKSLWYYETSQLSCNRGVWSLARCTLFEGHLKPIKFNCRQGGVGNSGTGTHTYMGRDF